MRVNVCTNARSPVPFLKGKNFVDMLKLTSKELRQELTIIDPICIFKIGAIGTPSISLNWGFALSKVTSVRHRSCLLRIAHGEVYTKEKLFRFGLNNSPNCPRCGSLENLEHKFITCTYVDRIWKEAFTYIDKINQTDQTEDKANLIIGMFKGTQPLILSILAEVLQRIMYLSDEANYLLRPKILVKRAIELVAKREQEEEIKNQINDLLSG